MYETEYKKNDVNSLAINAGIMSANNTAPVEIWEQVIFSDFS